MGRIVTESLETPPDRHRSLDLDDGGYAGGQDVRQPRTRRRTWRQRGQ